MSNELVLTDESFEKEVLKASDPVVVDFWAPWCGPCRMLAPVLDELAKEFAGKVRVGKINTDEHPKAATRFRISAIPTLLFFKGGELKQQLVGVHPKAEIKKHLESLLQ
jgi:thioredoxin